MIKTIKREVLGPKKIPLYGGPPGIWRSGRAGQSAPAWRNNERALALRTIGSGVAIYDFGPFINYVSYVDIKGAAGVRGIST